MLSLPSKPPGTVESAQVPELESAWSRVRTLLAVAYLWCPAAVLALSVITVVPTWTAGGAWWSIAPAVGVVVIAVIARLWLVRMGVMAPNLWLPFAFLAILFECAVGTMGGIAVVGASGAGEGRAISSIAFFLAWPFVIVAAVTSAIAMRTFLAPNNPVWGQSDLTVGYRVRYLGTPANPRSAARVVGPGRGPAVQVLSMSVSRDAITLAVGSPGYFGVVTSPDEGTYMNLQLRDVQDCRPVTLGQEVLERPWLTLRSGTPIWAAPGEAIVIRGQGGEFFVPVENAGMAADLIGQRARRATQQVRTECTL